MMSVQGDTLSLLAQKKTARVSLQKEKAENPIGKNNKMAYFGLAKPFLPK